jgi:type II secretory pathway component PulF
MLGSQLQLRDQLVSTLSYPAFVLATSVLAVGAILLFVIPSLAPLVDQPGSTPPLPMRLMIAASDLLRHQAPVLGVLAATLAAGLVVAARGGLLGKAMDRLVLDGPFRRTAAALVFGGFAMSLGAMLSAGAPMGEALRLAIRAIRSPLARRRIEPVLRGVRQGACLSDVLARAPGVPQSIVRLAAIGEASGGLGPMMARAGKLEEDAALRRIEAAGRLIGPALIVGLGAMIGLLMGGLLSGVTQIGDSALR